MPEPSRSPLRDQILDAARRHGAPDNLRSIEVPEWGCTIYWTPFTLREREEVRRRAIVNQADGQAHLIFLKAVDRDGNKLFDAADKLIFMDQADAMVVSRITEAMSADQPAQAAVEAAAKN